jgi:hypothetical protein
MKVNFTFLLDREVRDKAREAAKAYDMTLAQMMRRLLRDALRRYDVEILQRKGK